ncbi:MAG: MarR family transcriptional regulator [Treponema sp.]|nr:MarR family transcriptional regulator [Treponema sp.]
MPLTEISDTEFIILENLYAQEQQNLVLKQRDLAQLAKTSLGMINSILKRMAAKGWITARKINSRNIRYAITLEGINEVFHRSYSYFKRTIKNVAYYRDAVSAVIKEAADKKMKAVLLVGNSDIEFIIEHTCSYYGLSFLKSADMYFISGGIDSYTFIFYGEDIQYSPENNAANCVFISRLLLDVQVN